MGISKHDEPLREELSKEEARLMRLKQELTERRKEVLPQVGSTYNLTLENLSENDRLERQIEETEIKLREIRQKLYKQRGGIEA
jgi:hypothetical protein